MNVTINLFDPLLETGRRYHELGRNRDALAVLTRLSACREIPAKIAEEAQARLGELQLKRRKFVRARRHLTAALRHWEHRAGFELPVSAPWKSNRVTGCPGSRTDYWLVTALRACIELPPVAVPVGLPETL